MTTQWNQSGFGRWLRQARAASLPVPSQEAIAKQLGITQSLMSRWEGERPGTNPPSLRECVKLADVLHDDPLRVARMCGQWDDYIEGRVLRSLGFID